MRAMPVSLQFDKKGFRRGWLLANIIGTVVGELIAVALNIWWERYPNFLTMWPLDPEHDAIQNFPIYAALAGGILFGTILIGLGEQIIIRRYTHLPIRWLLASIIGAGTGGLFFTLPAIPFVYEKVVFPHDVLLGFLLFTAAFFLSFVFITGLVQWLVMRKTFFLSAKWIWKRIWSSLCSFFLFILFTPCCVWSMLFNKSYGSMGGFTYFLLLIFIPVPVALSALIIGSSIQNLLQNSAHKSVVSPVGEENHFETLEDEKPRTSQ
jgi:hypothetical protein